MSHPDPSHDRENEYPSDNCKPVRKEFRIKKNGQKKDILEGFRIPFKKGSAHEFIQKALTSKSKAINKYK